MRDNVGRSTSCAVLGTLIFALGAAAALAPGVAQCQTSSPGSSKQGAKASAATPKKAPDVSWTTDDDKFQDTHSVNLILHNTSKKDISFSMMLSGFGLGLILEFCDSPDCAKGLLQQNDAILLLNGSTRIYLGGSLWCKDINCLTWDSKQAMTPWIVSDLANAKSVEGRINGTEFSLNPAQIEAIGKLLENDRAFDRRTWLSYWQGKTATQAAELLSQRLRKDPPMKDSTSSRGVAFQLDHITNEELQVTQSNYWSDGTIAAKFRRSAKWKDLTFVATFMPKCGSSGEDKQCVHSTDLDGPSKGESEDKDWYSGCGWLDHGSDMPYSVALSYIYYRMMFQGDALSYYPD